MDGELVPCVARNADTEVELSLAEPTLGSLLVFCQGRQFCGRLFCATGTVQGLVASRSHLGDGQGSTHKLPPQMLHEALEDDIGHC
jgi:hypothetical protein